MERKRIKQGAVSALQATKFHSSQSCRLHEHNKSPLVVFDKIKYPTEIVRNSPSSPISGIGIDLRSMFMLLSGTKFLMLLPSPLVGGASKLNQK